MTYPEKPRILRPLAGGGVRAGWIALLAASPLAVGCSSHLLGASGPEQVAQRSSPEVCLASFQDSGQPYPEPRATAVALEPNGEANKPGNQLGNADEIPSPKQKITLPLAVALCVKNNFRVLAAAQGIQIAEADLTTSSLIPNPSLFADCQLIPLRHVDVNNQLGPPQWDVLASVPIDWLLFGKRCAAMLAARLGIEVASEDAANVLRVQLAQTVDAFYEVLTDEAYFQLAEKNLAELTELEKVTEELAKDKKVGALEVDRAKLAAHEALLERHDRELARDVAKARLRPFLGRTAADGDYEVEGALTVTAVVPPPKLEEAVALAEVHRPDLRSGRKAIDRANAVVELERRRAKPQVAVQPGWTYQDQAHQTSFRNGSLLDVGVSVTLPLTDRNQGNIHKAQARAGEQRLTYEGDLADALADVETSVASYDDAVEHLTLFNTPETLRAARDLRKHMEAAYRAGDRKLIDLLDAQKAYQSRLAHVIEFESDYWRWLNKLNAAVGLMAYDPVKGATRPLARDAEKK